MIRRAMPLPMPGIFFSSVVSARFRSTRVPDGYFSGAIRKVTALSLLAGELYNWTVLVSVSFGVMWI